MTVRRDITKSQSSKSNLSKVEEKVRLTDHQLDTVHAFTTNSISEVTEEKLSDKSSNGSSDFESEILIRSESSLVRSHVVDVTDHTDRQVDSEDIVGIYRRKRGLRGQQREKSFGRSSFFIFDVSISYSKHERDSPVKNPTPATAQAFTWNHPNLASSTSRKAARRFALRSIATSEIDESFSLNDILEGGRVEEERRKAVKKWDEERREKSETGKVGRIDRVSQVLHLTDSVWTFIWNENKVLGSTRKIASNVFEDFVHVQLKTRRLDALFIGVSHRFELLYHPESCFGLYNEFQRRKR